MPRSYKLLIKPSTEALKRHHHSHASCVSGSKPAVTACIAISSRQLLSLLEIVPRLRQRGVMHRYPASAESLMAVLEDARGVLAGTSAARHLGWPLPAGEWPVELYVPEGNLVKIVEEHVLEFVSERPADVVLRAVPDAWPFPPHLRVVPDVVAALDLAESLDPSLAELVRTHLGELARGIEPSWLQCSVGGKSIREKRPPRFKVWRDNRRR